MKSTLDPETLIFIY